MNIRLQRLRKVIRAHVNWFLGKVVGEDLLTPSDKEEMKELGLPPIKPIKAANKSFLLGKNRAEKTRKDYKGLTSKKLTSQIQGDLSHVEELAIEAAKARMASSVKRLADDIANKVFDKFSNAIGSEVTEFALRQVITDQTTQAIQQGKSAKEFADNLSKELKDGFSRDWELVAATEMTYAKTQGHAISIASKSGPYSKSGGPNSKVSVIPHANCCDDCRHQYLLPNGNPKVFELAALMGAGSNGDEGVSHKRSRGIHTGWAPTLPPLHPRCQCQLTFVPEDMYWENGKLTGEAIIKAGNLDSTRKPKGPPQPSPIVSAAASPPSISGAPAPGNMPGPGRPKEGKHIDWEYYQGEGSPPANGGWEQSPNGKWRRPSGSVGGRGAGEEDQEQKKTFEEAKMAALRKPKPATVQDTINHLEMSEITHQRELVEEQTVDQVFMTVMKGNGCGVLKKPAVTADRHHYGDGIGTVPWNTQVNNEIGAYKLFSALGLDFCPPTTKKAVDGEVLSHQAFKATANAEDLTSLTALAKNGEDGPKGLVHAVTNRVKDPDKVVKAFTEITVMDLLMNNQDRHSGNILIDPDASDVYAIDHGLSFGSGMMSMKSVFFRAWDASGRHLKLEGDLKSRLETTSLGDMKRALGDTHKDWQIGQTFLRGQYLLHLQETEGRLDYKHFEPLTYTADGSFQVDPRSGGFLNGLQKGSEDARDRWEEKVKSRDRFNDRSDSNSKFEDFAIAWLDRNASDPSSPHHESAKELKQLGVFMEAGSARDPEEYRKFNRHKNYEQDIRSGRFRLEEDLMDERGRPWRRDHFTDPRHKDYDPEFPADWASSAEQKSADAAKAKEVQDMLAEFKKYEADRLAADKKAGDAPKPPGTSTGAARLSALKPPPKNDKSEDDESDVKKGLFLDLTVPWVGS